MFGESTIPSCPETVEKASAHEIGEFTFSAHTLKPDIDPEHLDKYLLVRFDVKVGPQLKWVKKEDTETDQFSSWSFTRETALLG